MHNQTMDLTGRTNLEELVAIIDNLDILVTNDGGPLHIAVALGKKTVSFLDRLTPKFTVLIRLMKNAILF